jgi:ABC-type multidrug transport system fused ATPase/permease subunit
VLVLDEPTSAVDAHTEAAIAGRLKQVRRGRITVVLTSSPLLLEQAEEVFVIDGTLVARGRHHDLLRDNAAYRGLVTRGLERLESEADQG